MEEKKKTPIKKRTGNSATGKPLDKIEINPQLNTMKQNEDSVALTPTLQERKALTVVQRQKRSRSFKRNIKKIEHAKEISKSKFATQEKLKNRSVVAARNLIKKRFSARKGIPYAELSTSEKIQVDKAVDKKTAVIQKLAKRLLPRITQAEKERFKSFQTGAKLKDLSTKHPEKNGILPAIGGTKTNEEFNRLFANLNNEDTNGLVDIIGNMIGDFKKDSNPLAETLQKMLSNVINENSIDESLFKKAVRSGVPFSTLKEIFNRGMSDWDSTTARINQEQFAFTRVNSYVARGKAYKVDNDLHESVKSSSKLDENFEKFISSINVQFANEEIEAVDEITIQNKTLIHNKIKELKAKGTPTKKLNMIAKKKYMKADGQKIKVGEETGHTKCGTPECCGQCGPKDLDEAFNIAFAAGIGVSLTSADLGMRMQGAFAHHPSVVEEMDDMEEEVSAADQKAVRVAGRRIVNPETGEVTFSPTTTRKQKIVKSIIKSGNLTDGKPDEIV
jgi:hypothetical protein